MVPTPAEAYELLKKHNEGEFHLKHGKIVGGVMRRFAIELGYGDEADFWKTVVPLKDGNVRIIFDLPVRAVTPGQAAVLYDGDTVLGGGTIV